MRDEILGTRLLELISMVEQENPRKITGMLLELTNKEIVDMLSPTVCGCLSCVLLSRQSFENLGGSG